MRSEIFLEENLKEAQKKGLIKGSDINLERVQRGIERLTGSVRKRVLKVFERVAQGLKHGVGSMSSLSPAKVAGAASLLMALGGGTAGCTFDVTGLGDLKFKDAQADGADTGGGGDGVVNPGDARGDAEIGVNPLDTGDLGDILDDLDDVLYVPETEVKGEVKDVGGDDGSEPVDTDVGDKQDVPETKDIPDEEVPDPCAGVDCDDKDPCTDDKCEEATGQCASTPKPLTDDGDECTTESCGADGETVHTPVDPNDDDPCTDDLCDPATGKKTNTPKNVDDKNPCTDDLCDPVTGEPINTDKDCGDDNPFTTDACNPATGECTHVPPVCDDGNPCTKDGYDPVKGCSNEPVDCEDGDACTEGDACNPENGKCESTPKDCSDGDGCTKDICLPPEGDCVNPLKPIESDGNPCTKDGCDPATGLPTHDEIPCSDGSACTVWDECDPADGKCKGETVDCDDANACTKDTCDPATGCKNTPVNTDDKNACTKDACDKTTGAVTHTPVNVSDGKTCTTDGCNPQTGEIVHALNDTVCAALNDQCAKGVCSPGESTADPITGCTKSFLAFNGAPCDDGDKCSFDDLCDMGICTSVDWMDCDDGVACTKDSCDGATGGCANVADDGECGDGNPCTNNECDLVLGCTKINNTSPCSDGAKCTVDDTCTEGVCEGAEKDCYNKFYLQTCYEGTGACVVKGSQFTLKLGGGPDGLPPHGKYVVKRWHDGVVSTQSFDSENAEVAFENDGNWIFWVRKDLSGGADNFWLHIEGKGGGSFTLYKDFCLETLPVVNKSTIDAALNNEFPQPVNGINLVDYDPKDCISGQIVVTTE